MKIPLIGIASPYSRNLKTGDLQAIIVSNGSRNVVKIPYEPHCFIPDRTEGENYRVTGRTDTMRLRREPYSAGGELPKGVILDGARENIMDRLVIEYPEFFYKYANTEPIRRARSLSMGRRV